MANEARVVVPNVATTPLPEALRAGREVLQGAPEAHHRTLLEGVRGTVGIWEMTEGRVRDVEADEVFLVASGQAVLDIDGEPAIALHPGVLVQLRAGDRTTWTVTERLRKVYLQLP